MFENIKAIMKKAAALSLSAAMLCFAACGEQAEYDFANADLSKYVSLPDMSIYTHEKVMAEYESEKKKANEEKNDKYSLFSGSSFDFYVTSYVKNGEKFERYEPYCFETLGESVKQYFVLKNASSAAFDKCLMMNVSNAEDTAESARIIENGKAFSFVIKVSDDCDNKDIAGKEMRFVITPEDHFEVIVSESAIMDLCKDYIANAPEKETVAWGDAVYISVVVSSGSNTIYTDTDMLLFVGENFFYPGFDELLVGKSKGSATFSATFASNTFGVNDALYAANGKTVTFYTNITKICETDGIFDGTNGIDSVWSMKEHCRLQVFAKNHIYNSIIKEAKLESYPKSGYKYLKSSVETRIDEYIEYYTEYLSKLVTDADEKYVLEYFQKDVFGSAEYSTKEDLIEALTLDSLEYIIINNAIADKAGIEYTAEEYEADLKKAILASGAYEAGEDISEAEKETIGGRQYWHATFVIEKAMDMLANTALANS